MTDSKETGDAPRKSKGPEIVTRDDGSPVLDFGDYATAAAQAEALGGTVDAIGTAYHVVVPE